jgi:cell division protein FtsL
MNTIKKFLYVGIPILAFVLVVVQVVMTNELAGVRNEIRKLDSEIATLADDHDLLSQQVASASALATVSEKANMAGFVSPTKSNVIALDDSITVALNLPASTKPAIQ